MYNSASNEYMSRLMFPKDGANKFSISKFVFWRWHILSICNITNTSITMTHSQKSRKDTFINLIAEQASGERNTISAHSALAKIYINKLVHSKDQNKLPHWQFYKS